MKITNMVKIAALLEHGGLTFPEIIDQTGIPASAARNAIFILHEEGKITSQPTAKTGKMGRPPVRYSLQTMEVA
jgi:predicted ArsR family transcriptional regulator